MKEIYLNARNGELLLQQQQQQQLLPQGVGKRTQGMHLAYFSGNEMFWRVIWLEKYKRSYQQQQQQQLLLLIVKKRRRRM